MIERRKVDRGGLRREEDHRRVLRYVRWAALVVVVYGCTTAREPIPDPGPEASRGIACYYFNRECER
jgi:hypothetical protein